MVILTFYSLAGREQDTSLESILPRVDSTPLGQFYSFGGYVLGLCQQLNEYACFGMCRVFPLHYVLYSSIFLRCIIFTVFADSSRTAKIKLAKCFVQKTFALQIKAEATLKQLTRSCRILKVSSLKAIPSHLLLFGAKHRRSLYTKFTPEQKYRIDTWLEGFKHLWE